MYAYQPGFASIALQSASRSVQRITPRKRPPIFVAKAVMGIDAGSGTPRSLRGKPLPRARRA